MVKGSAVNFTRKEILQLQIAVKIRHNEAGRFHVAESRKERNSCKCMEKLKVLASLKNKLLDERAQFDN